MSRTITTEDLAQRVDDAAREPFILDVRAEDRFDRWRIESEAELVMENIPYWTAHTDLAQIIDKLPEHQEVVVGCGHGGSSGMVAEMVDRLNVHNLEGGIGAWANTLVPRTLYDDGSQYVIQLDRIAKACLSYAVGARGGTMSSSSVRRPMWPRQ